MRILVATSNPHKLDEIAAVFAAQAAVHRDAQLHIELVGLRDVAPDLPEPIEDQDTFEDNALLKAAYYATRTGMCCLADDSGLAVDVLGGAPGVYSARYAGVAGPRAVVDPENNKRLLRELADYPADQRTARFICAMALVDPAAPGHGDAPPRVIAQVRGTIEGRILGPGDSGFHVADPASNYRGRGRNGFGYDPLFFLPERGCTTAELPPDQKNAISHRGQATRLLWEHLAQQA